MTVPVLFDRNAPGTKCWTFEGVPTEELPLAFFKDHSRALTALVGAFGGYACKILARTELLSKPATHVELAEFYMLSRVAAADLTCLTILPSPHEWHVVVSATLIHRRLTFVVDVGSALDLISPGFRDRCSWEDFLHVYLYFVYCQSAFAQSLTAFINIDDWDLLVAARAEVRSALAGGDVGIVRKFPTAAMLCLFGNIEATLGRCNGKVYVAKNATGKDWLLADRPVTASGVACYLPEPDFSTIREQCYRLFAYLLETQEVITADTETTGLDYRGDSIVSCGLAMDTHLGFYISINHRKPAKMQLEIGEKGFIRGAASKALLALPNASKSARRSMFDAAALIGDNEDNIPQSNFRELAIEVLTKKKLIFHNAKFDFSMVYCQIGVRLPLYMDTMLAHYVARPGIGDPSKDKHGLQHVAVNELGIPDWKGDITKCQAEPKDIVGAYNARDCCYTQAISYVMWQDLDPADPDKPAKLFWEIEMKFLEPMIFSELEGLHLDKEKLDALKVKLQARMKEIETEFGTIAGNPDFNINSGPQLAKLFYEQMAIKPIRRCKKCTYQHQEDSEKCPKCGEDSPIKRVTPAGKPALDKYVLEDLGKMKVGGAQMLLEYRKAAKIVSAYTNLPEKANKLTGKIHPSYNQSRVITGRLCVAKGTLVDVVRDISKFPKGIPVEDVKEGDWAYTYDDQLQLRLRKVVWAGKTGTKKVIRIEWLGTGRHTRGELRLTPEHLVRKTDGSYVRADALKSMDRVLSLSRTITTGYARLHAYGRKELRDNRFIGMELWDVSETQHVHHKDENRLNNSIDNLVVVEGREHTRAHTTKMNNTPEAKVRLSEYAKNMWREGRHTVRRGKDASNYKETTKAELLRLAAKVKGKISHAAMDFNTFKQKCREHGIDHLAIHYRYTTAGAYIPRWKITAALSLPNVNQMGKFLGTWNSHVQSLIKYYAHENHIITGVFEENEVVDVYDIEVEGTHNFIANELCVHNSSANPNFQQLPKRGSKEIRDAILPSSRGHCLVAADYSGQEVRILAAYSRDEKLIQAYNPCVSCIDNKDPLRRCHLNKGTCPLEDHTDPDSRCNIMDIHSFSAKQIHGAAIDVPISMIKDHPIYDKYRTMAKGLSFALSYGGGAWGIADKNNITIDEAQKIMDDYFHTFPGVKKFILQCQQYCDQYGEIRDMVGRRRLFRYAGWADPRKLEQYYENGGIDLRSGLRWINNKEYRRDISGDRRAATNYPIQALAAAMTKIGVVKLYEELKKAKLDAVIVAYIHDEAALSVRRDPDTLEEVGRLIRKAMVESLDMAQYVMPNDKLDWSWPVTLDMDVDIKAGETYGSLAEFHKYVEALRKEDLENLELLGEDPDAEDAPEE